MTDIEIQIGRDMHTLMSTITELSKVSVDPVFCTFIAREANDLELAYSQIGRLLNRVRATQRNQVVPMEAAE